MPPHNTDFWLRSELKMPGECGSFPVAAIFSATMWCGGLIVSHAERLLQQQRTTVPLDATRVFAWKRAMLAGERKAFEKVAGDALEECGDAVHAC
jgi:hypothetical protein